MKLKKQRTRKATATQRLEALEKGQKLLLDSLNRVMTELTNSRNLISALSKRLNAVVEAAEGGELTAKKVNELLVKKNEEELKSKVETLLKSKLLEKDEEVTEESFIVGKEFNQDGEVVNPRIQFALGNMPKEIQEKLLGKKVGDSIPPEEDNGLTFQISEVYKIVQENTNQSFEAQQ